jgi:hypothetical protein
MVKGRESCANVASRVGLGTQCGRASHGSGLVPIEWLQCEGATKCRGTYRRWSINGHVTR